MATNDGARKTCFVVMGFGEKTDFQTQRLLDLDKTYRIIIRPAVEDAGLKCIPQMMWCTPGTSIS